MGERYKAEFKLIVRVEFEDNGKDSIADQAFDALGDSDLHVGDKDVDAELIAKTVKPKGCISMTIDTQALRALMERATDENLSDDGRYFADSLDDLTRCRHQEIGEYQNPHDGKLVEWLWNHRKALLDGYEASQARVAELEAHQDILINALGEAMLVCAKYSPNGLSKLEKFLKEPPHA